MAIWKSLYLSCADDCETITKDIAQTLRDTLHSFGYEDYDPFGGSPGKSYSQTVKLFIAPTQNGWIRLIGDVNEHLFEPLSRIGTCLYAALENDAAEIRVFIDSVEADVIEELTPHLTTDHPPETLRAALTGQLSTNVDNTSVSGEAAPVPLEALPQNIQDMAQQLNSRQVGKLFNRFMKQVGKRVSGDQEAAAALLQRVDWNSDGARQLEVLMRCLNITNWRLPDFVTVRDAYQLSRRRERFPNARVMPGNEETLQAVPDALTYVPIYVGK